MKTYIVTYDLVQPGRDYSELFKAIKSIADGWWHHLDSFWLINTNLDAGQIRDHLGGYVDENDKLLVMRAGANWASLHLSKRANDWLHSSFRPVQV